MIHTEEKLHLQVNHGVRVHRVAHLSLVLLWFRYSRRLLAFPWAHLVLGGPGEPTKCHKNKTHAQQLVWIPLVCTGRWAYRNTITPRKARNTSHSLWNTRITHSIRGYHQFSSVPWPLEKWTTLYHVSFWTNNAGVAPVTFLTFWSMDAFITWLARRPSITQRSERPWLTLRMKTNTQTTNKPGSLSPWRKHQCHLIFLQPVFIISFKINWKDD